MGFTLTPGLEDLSALQQEVVHSPAPPIIPHLPGVWPKGTCLFDRFSLLFSILFVVISYISLAVRHQSAMLQSSPSSSETNMADQGYSY